MFHYDCNFLQYLPYSYHTYVSKFVWGYTCGIFAEPKTQRKVVVLLVIINFKEILMSCQQRYTKYPADVGNEYCATWANNASHVKCHTIQYWNNLIKIYEPKGLNNLDFSSKYLFMRFFIFDWLYRLIRNLYLVGRVVKYA